MLLLHLVGIGAIAEMQTKVALGNCDTDDPQQKSLRHDPKLKRGILGSDDRRDKLLPAWWRGNVVTVGEIMLLSEFWRQMVDITES